MSGPIDGVVFCNEPGDDVSGLLDQPDQPAKPDESLLVECQRLRDEVKSLKAMLKLMVLLVTDDRGRGGQQ